MKPIKDKNYDPYPSAISIHNNLYERKPGIPISTDPLGTIVGKKFGENVPHILYDGIKNPKMLDANGKWLAGQCINIQNNKNQSIASLDVEHGFMAMARADDAFNCNNQ